MKRLKQILCIDDSEADQLLHRFRIADALPDADVRAVTSAEEALSLIVEEDYSPDLIFLDLNMPRMSGFDFLEAYEAAFPTEPPAPAIILSSSEWEADKSRAEDFGSVYGFLQKPLTPAWGKTVESLLSAKDT